MLPNTIPPGEFLQEILNERNISQSRLARHIGVEPGVINLICSGKRGISAVMAKKLARALGTDVELWVNLQNSYDLTRAEEPKFGRLQERGSIKGDSIKGVSVKRDSVRGDSVRGDGVRGDSVRGGSGEGIKPRNAGVRARRGKSQFAQKKILARKTKAA
jgi:addiction module HigA family antidote